MKPKLLLFLSRLDLADNTALAATLGWLAESCGMVFDLYYDSYHEGIHFPGGDTRDLEVGQLTGGTISGDHHFEEFYRALLNFDVSAAVFRGSIFEASLASFGVVAARATRVVDFYAQVFGGLGVSLPRSAVLVGSRTDGPLKGLQAYLYPEIFYRRALGVPDCLPPAELLELCGDGRKIFSVHADPAVVLRLQESGCDIEVVDRIGPHDNYLEISRRLAERWSEKARGWILGDPVLVAHWTPKATEEGLISVYSVPQGRIVRALGGVMARRGKVVYGRQHDDKDFFDLSERGQCFQVIDPCRPPFQSTTHAPHRWAADSGQTGFFEPEFSDSELSAFAREGRILVSLMFWSGMIREIANLYRLMDLVALTRLRCGLVLTAQSFEYMMHAPLELLTVPVERGGVQPLVEPVLGSCGLGVGIESRMTGERLAEDLREGLARIFKRVEHPGLLPRGWWPTLDTDLIALGPAARPGRIRLRPYAPRVQVRYHPREVIAGGDAGSARDDAHRPAEPPRLRFIKTIVRATGMAGHILPYRPYEGYGPGRLREDIVRAAKSAGLEYMLTKSGFLEPPRAAYLDDHFVAFNTTAGQWDGWTPFETVNHVSDLARSERKLLRRRKPGWIVGTVDTCLWTFAGEVWERGAGLAEIVRFCATGGRSGELLNVKPYTIARYARIISSL